jgi:hypothetical protein
VGGVCYPSVGKEDTLMCDRPPLKTALSRLVLLFLVCAWSLSAARPDQLGKVNFPTTCSSDVQPTIDKGLALLHSF